MSAMELQLNPRAGLGPEAAAPRPSAPAGSREAFADALGSAREGVREDKVAPEARDERSAPPVEEGAAKAGEDRKDDAPATSAEGSAVAAAAPPQPATQTLLEWLARFGASAAAGETKGEGAGTAVALGPRGALGARAGAPALAPAGAAGASDAAALGLEPAGADGAAPADGETFAVGNAPSFAAATAATAATAAMPQAEGAAPVAEALPAPAATAAPATAVPAAGPAAATPAGAPALHAMATPLHSPDFAGALAARLTLLAREGVQQAQLQLNPLEMGPITVQIALEGVQAQVDFSAAHAGTREVLASSLPALAAALHGAGLQLAGGGVSEQRSGAAHEGDGGTADGRNGNARTEGAGGAAPAVPLPRRAGHGLLDLYA